MTATRSRRLVAGWASTCKEMHTSVEVGTLRFLLSLAKDSEYDSLTGGKFPVNEWA